MGAVFWLESTFTIAGRGLVLAGQVAEGTICPGDVVVIPVGVSHWRERITGVELREGCRPAVASRPAWRRKVPTGCAPLRERRGPASVTHRSRGAGDEGVRHSRVR